LLESARGRRIALVINEFGDLGIDGELLKGCGDPRCAEGNLFELANGCICCTVADEFLPTMRALLDRPEAPDHIVIETSGLALPKPLVKAFNWPEVRSRVTVDGVVAVIDGPATAAGLFADDPEAVIAQRAADPTLDHDNPLEELFEDQLACADLVLLNKADLMPAGDLARVLSDLRARLRPGIQVLQTVEARVPPEILLGMDAAVEDDIESRPSHHDVLDDHDHDDFESLAVEMDGVAAPEVLVERIEWAVAAHDLLRVKGFVDVAGKPMRLVLQGVGRRLHWYFDREWRAGEKRRTELVIVGRAGLDGAAIRRAITG
jgi:cobalamin biosynthesis protein CobW